MNSIPATDHASGDIPEPSEPAPDKVIDITRDLCPMTFVKTRIALDRLSPGQILLVRLRGDEPRRNVPRTAAEQGHTVLAQHQHADGTTTLLLRKGQ
jgi:TusA-related sulfurtransferase